jgi:hypothetical protein
VTGAFCVAGTPPFQNCDHKDSIVTVFLANQGIVEIYRRNLHILQIIDCGKESTIPLPQVNPQDLVSFPSGGPGDAESVSVLLFAKSRGDRLCLNAFFCLTFAVSMSMMTYIKIDTT